MNFQNRDAELKAKLRTRLREACKALGYKLNKCGMILEAESFVIEISDQSTGGTVSLEMPSNLANETMRKLEKFMKKMASGYDIQRNASYRKCMTAILTSLLIDTDQPTVRRPRSPWKGIGMDEMILFKIFLDFGFSASFEYQGIVIKPDENIFERFIRKYLELYGKLPEKEFEKLVSSSFTYKMPIKPLILIDKPIIYENLPKELSTLYKLACLKKLTHEETRDVEKLLDSNKSKRTIAGIIFYLRFEKDERLDMLFSRYVEEKVSRANTFSVLVQILSWLPNQEIMNKNFPKTIRSLMKKMLNREVEHVKACEEENQIKISSKLRNEDAIISIIVIPPNMTMEIEGSSPIPKGCKTKLEVEFFTQKCINRRFLSFLDDFISKSLTYIKMTEKICKRALSKIPPEIMKFSYVAGKPIEIFQAFIPSLKVSGDIFTSRDNLIRYDVAELKVFERKLKEALDDLMIAIGKKVFFVNDFDKTFQKPSRRDNVYKI